MNSESANIIDSNLRKLQKHYMFQIATWAQCVSLLQNSEIFDNEIKNSQNWRLSINNGLMFNILASNLSLEYLK